MKKIYIIIGIVILLLIIGYFTNWFGLKKKNISSEVSGNRIAINSKYSLACMPNCKLSTDTKGASETNTMNGIKYTCRCTDGATSAPIVVNN